MSRQPANDLTFLEEHLHSLIGLAVERTAQMECEMGLNLSGIPRECLIELEKAGTSVMVNGGGIADSKTLIPLLQAHGVADLKPACTVRG